jgi:hypothetical protein
MRNPLANPEDDTGHLARMIMDIIMAASLVAGVAIWISWVAAH